MNLGIPLRCLIGSRSLMSLSAFCLARPKSQMVCCCATEEEFASHSLSSRHRVRSLCNLAGPQAILFSGVDALKAALDSSTQRFQTHRAASHVLAISTQRQQRRVSGSCSERWTNTCSYDSTWLYTFLDILIKTHKPCPVSYPESR